MLTIDLEKLPSYRIGERRGMEQGAHEKAQAIAKELLNAGIPPTQVVMFTQLSLAEIEGLKKGQMDA